MAKEIQLNIRIEPIHKEALVQAAKADGRSISNYVTMAIMERMERDGFVPERR
jgi:uncharacterized protein (DUF1778 family)